MSIRGLYFKGETLPILSYEVSNSRVGFVLCLKICSSLSLVCDIFFLYDFMVLTDLIDFASRLLSGVRSKGLRGPRLFARSRTSILE